MLQDYRVPFPLSPPYAGHAGSISAQVVDTGGTVVQTITGFTERGTGTGDYGATARMDTALAARIVFAWGATPALAFIPPRLKLPTGLPPDTLYPYPMTFPPGPAFAGQASSVSAQIVDTSGTVLATITTFTEVAPGLYEANPLFSSSWNGEIQYAWSGTPTIPVIRSVLLLPATAEGSSTTTLTATDIANIGAALLTDLASFAPFAWLSVLRTAAAARPPLTGNVIKDPFVPGTDLDIERAYTGLDPTVGVLTSITLALRTGSPPAPIAGFADRVITPTPGNPLQGQITDTGTVNTQYGTVSARARYHWSRAETALVRPGTKLNYYTLGTTSTGAVLSMEDGTWQAVTGGGPLG